MKPRIYKRHKIWFVKYPYYGELIGYPTLNMAFNALELYFEINIAPHVWQL